MAMCQATPCSTSNNMRVLMHVVLFGKIDQASNMAITSTREEIIEGDDMIDIDSLLDDDALMSMTFD